MGISVGLLHHCARKVKLGEMNAGIKLLLLCFTCYTSGCAGYNILFLSPMTMPSHTNFFKPVVKALAERNHTITYWNGLKPDESLTDLSNVRPLYSENIGKLCKVYNMTINDWGTLKNWRKFFTLYDRTVVYCHAIHQDPIFHQLLKAEEKFDLIVIEGILNECVLPLVGIYKVPFIFMVGVAPTPWLLDAIGSPLAHDHFPVPTFRLTDEMNFLERTANCLMNLFGVAFRNNMMMSAVDRIAAQHANLSGSAKAIEDEYLSLLITNSHPGITYGLSKATALIEAGGLHCVPSKPLPEDLETFVNDSGDSGFILVSFGSILHGADMPEATQNVFINTFARLRQRVIWKWGENLETNIRIPSTVKLMSWLPQQDLLGHPKIKLFITHAGLFSIEEAIYHGVPLIAVPVFADQPLNAQKLHNVGYGIHLDWDQLTVETLYGAIQEVLNNPTYKEKVKQMNALMLDQPEHPLDRAVFWIEHVIRHKGALHLRTAARKLSLLQREHWDIHLALFLLSLMFLCGIIGTFFMMFKSAKSNIAKKND